MIDLCAIPSDTPGWSTPDSGAAPSRAAAMETAIRQEHGDSRLLPYVQVHEFETLLYADLSELAGTLGDDAGASAVEALAAEVAGVAPEDVDDGPDTAPSKRILKHVGPRYRKRVYGVQTTASIGLAALRSACPRFDAWVTTLEALAEQGE
jgi:hypothetical protein